ncbi:hypothetical protein H4219_005557 [Mycoemilia scoparia]|uniref:PB1 domain-containing protein n=1 Tax=Mycoemilia scoparia TaxID=417184 RepID=A0A9W7ZNU4_9FUNG|nr:hypothetical protein H4219_005557 [Mycoemilia scoparia]
MPEKRVVKVNRLGKLFVPLQVDPANTNWDSLRSEVLSLVELKDPSIRCFYYEDDEGDKVGVACDHDVEEMFAITNPNDPIKLYMVRDSISLGVDAALKGVNQQWDSIITPIKIDVPKENNKGKAKEEEEIKIEIKEEVKEEKPPKKEETIKFEAKEEVKITPPPPPPPATIDTSKLESMLKELMEATKENNNISKGLLENYANQTNELNALNGNISKMGEGLVSGITGIGNSLEKWSKMLSENQIKLSSTVESSFKSLQESRASSKAETDVEIEVSSSSSSDEDDDGGKKGSTDTKIKIKEKVKAEAESKQKTQSEPQAKPTPPPPAPEKKQEEKKEEVKVKEESKVNVVIEEQGKKDDKKKEEIKIKEESKVNVVIEEQEPKKPKVTTPAPASTSSGPKDTSSTNSSSASASASSEIDVEVKSDKGKKTDKSGKKEEKIKVTIKSEADAEAKTSSSSSSSSGSKDDTKTSSASGSASTNAVISASSGSSSSAGSVVTSSSTSGTVSNEAPSNYRFTWYGPDFWLQRNQANFGSEFFSKFTSDVWKAPPELPSFPYNTDQNKFIDDHIFGIKSATGKIDPTVKEREMKFMFQLLEETGGDFTKAQQYWHQSLA